MNFTINSTCTVTKKFNVDATIIPVVSTATISLWVKTGDATARRYNATSITIVSGVYLATFTNVPLIDGYNSLKITAESNVDLDAAGTSLYTIGSGLIYKGGESTLAVINGGKDWAGYPNIVTAENDPLMAPLTVFNYISPSDTFAYSGTNNRITISKGGVTKSFNVYFNGTAYEIILPSGTSPGTVQYGPITLWGDGVYTITVYRESVTDSDTNGTTFTKIGYGTLKRVTPATTFNL